jgi:hypothetical protein
MTTFSTDADLLKWEPALLREIAMEDQCLARGTGASSAGLVVTATAARFQAGQVRPGHVIHLVKADLSVDGYYEVLSVESETQLTASLVGAKAGEWPSLPTATALDFDIHTFDPQHEEARWALLTRFGLETDAEQPGADLEQWIARKRAFSRASVALVLATIYRGQSAAGPEAGGLARKADHYARVYEDEVARARVVLDRDGDGLPDDVRSLSSHRLVRD